ncbi:MULTISPECIES: aldehyde dehydrogenase [Flavobacterium]|uniref:Aldehyde dehydrogenase n=2 Tax=Flavobacterium TaxID=237 RepID=A0AA94F1R9_9FLAO|nr:MULTISPECIES: aldehyde dehydrogenase [Flavobacterium]OXA79304.1 aldehyde dehydrogenase [Flavobacterium columnare] [Flavobacterium columnare NBRC 100251 = ATCC 23463]AMA49076.1 aldehyde dehydrogenase [Flavobacterium covae]AND64850.1 aldehyde dehydrogenase [Flavobacterium covae]MCH4831008.1 aldehyde dehydrogenase [Flavobacterium columnare]MCH4833051.1 aldehyde dehydrogenase [Flavobacterium columnare]
MYTVSQRKKVLSKLLDNLVKYETDMQDALYKDFKKPRFESMISETEYIINELRYTIKKLDSWAKPKRVFPSLLNFPSADYLYSEPYGKILIISPWNYPIQLAFSPLIAAVAAGNKVTLKPSELTPNSSSIISKIVRETFEIDQVVVITGDYTIAQDLLSKRWDYIFFTGSVPVGKIVAKAAAENLTPVTLELGGKSPSIVDQTADLKLAAKRIIWGKIFNAGQTCIAPDYLIVHKSIKEKMIPHLIQEIQNALGSSMQESEDFARIINLKNWKRQQSFLENQTILFGGQTNETDLYVSPTLLDEPNLESSVMKEEIFGPILPIISYTTKEELYKIVNRFEKPLALYLFTKDKSFEKDLLSEISFGGGCINDTLSHFSNKNLPFGGVGHSGIGAYHGKLGFETFSHQKSIVKKSNWIDLPFRYAPYKGKFQMVKKILKWL